MVCAADEFTGTLQDDFRFTNWLRNVDITVDRYFRPDSRAALVWLAQQATRTGRRLHAVGSGWSFEDNMVSPDWMVDLQDLNRVNLDVLDVASGGIGALSDFWARRVTDRDSHLVHVEAGIQIFDLNNYLHGRGFAMRSLGGSQGQSLAGVISTSTHGGDIDEPPLCDYVKAIHLVTQEGRELWVESSSRPLTNDAIFRDRLIPEHACDDIEIIRDDALLHAIQVSVGRFGIIYAVVVDVRDWFNLVEWTVPSTWSNVATLLRDGLNEGRGLQTLLDGLPQPDPTRFRDLADDPRDRRPKVRYLEFLINSRSSDQLVVRRRWETTSTNRVLREDNSSENRAEEAVIAASILNGAATAIRLTIPLVALIPFYGIGRSIELEANASRLTFMSLDPHVRLTRALVEAVNTLWDSDEFGGFAPIIDEIINTVFNDRDEVKRGAEGFRGVSWQVMSGLSPDPGNTRVNSLEVVFSTQNERYIDFITFLMRIGRNYRQAGYIAVRYSASSEASLSMHSFDDDHSVSIEVATIEGFEHNTIWMNVVEGLAVEWGGRPHWGQHNNLQSHQVSRLYGDKLQRWREQLLRVCGDSATFSNRYTEQRGLEARYVTRQVTHVRRENGRITHLCNPEAYWSPVPAERIISEYVGSHGVHVGRTAFPRSLGDINYVTRPENPNIPEGQVIVQQVLCTTPDDAPGNNLRALPGRAQRYAYAPPRDTRRREITSVVRNIWGGVEHLNNDDEEWSVFDAVAFVEINSGGIEYFVRDPETGTESVLQTKTFLSTFADGLEDNNLGALPEEVLEDLPPDP